MCRGRGAEELCKFDQESHRGGQDEGGSEQSYRLGSKRILELDGDQVDTAQNQAESQHKGPATENTDGTATEGQPSTDARQRAGAKDRQTRLPLA